MPGYPKKGEAILQSKLFHKARPMKFEVRKYFTGAKGKLFPLVIFLENPQVYPFPMVF
jgi:hypothetical protein